MTSESFETRLQRFYDGCTPEEQRVVAAMCGLFVAAGRANAGDVAGYGGTSSSDLSQQQVMSAYQRSVQNQSNTQKTYHDILRRILQNTKG